MTVRSRQMHAACADAFNDQAESFTCNEAQALARWMLDVTEVGASPASVAAFMRAHAAGDDEGDMHHNWTADHAETWCKVVLQEQKRERNTL